jgi:hypothetical protein
MVSRLAGDKTLPADLLDQILDKERDGHERTEVATKIKKARPAAEHGVQGRYQNQDKRRRVMPHRRH